MYCLEAGPHRNGAAPRRGKAVATWGIGRLRLVSVFFITKHSTCHFIAGAEDMSAGCTLGRIVLCEAAELSNITSIVCPRIALL